MVQVWKTEERDSRVWPREKWNESHFSRGLWLSFLVLCWLNRTKRLLRRLGLDLGAKPPRIKIYGVGCPVPRGGCFLLGVSRISCRSFHCLRIFTLLLSLPDIKALARTVYVSLKFLHPKRRQIPVFQQNNQTNKQNSFRLQFFFTEYNKYYSHLKTFNCRFFIGVIVAHWLELTMRSICGPLFLQAMFIGFARHTKVTATRHCPKFTSCIDSYPDIYKSLASEENSFNIESALYPAMMPSSLVVKVEFITRNETSVANYTWSLNCLYVAIPPQVLQLLSLGSVLVEPRTQELKICIPYFCRNFSSTKEQNDLMRGVLAAVRNFTLNVWYFHI